MLDPDPGAYLGFCQGGCTFLADLPPPPGSGSGSGSGSASKQCGSTALGPLFLHYLIRNCFVKRTKNMMAKKKVIKIKGAVSRDLLALSFPLQSMPSGPLMNRLNWGWILSHIHKDIPWLCSKIKKYFSLFIRAPDGMDRRRKKWVKNLVTLSLQDI